MTAIDVIDVVASKPALAELLAVAEPGGSIGLPRLSQIAVGKADSRDVERHGDAWLASLAETARRGGVGRLERGRSGVVFGFEPELPALDIALARALDSLGPHPSPGPT
jgi:hypothetical protein